MEENQNELLNALKALNAPIPESQMTFRPTLVFRRGKVAYAYPKAVLDTAAIYKRLDDVVGVGHWSTVLKRQGKRTFSCALMVFGVTRMGVGTATPDEPEPIKRAAEDALRSAALAFGIGQDLEDLTFEPVRVRRGPQGWRFESGWQASPLPKQLQLTQTAKRPAPTDPATDVHLYRIEREIRRVGWDEDREKAHLLDTVGKASRFELTVEEASALLRHLRVLGSHTWSR
jgi:hypothetical protein